MTSNHTESSHVQIQESNGIGRPSWRAGSVHVDIDAFDVSMDIGHRQAKIGSSSNVRSATGKAGRLTVRTI